eukprot:1425612-Rhodomonas_salina.2
MRDSLPPERDAEISSRIIERSACSQPAKSKPIQRRHGTMRTANQVALELNWRCGQARDHRIPDPRRALRL